MMGLAPATAAEEEMEEGASTPAAVPARKPSAAADVIPAVTPREIKKLDEAVVNRIAAGEVGFLFGLMFLLMRRRRALTGAESHRSACIACACECAPALCL